MGTHVPKKFGFFKNKIKILVLLYNMSFCPLLCKMTCYLPVAELKTPHKTTYHFARECKMTYRSPSSSSPSRWVGQLEPTWSEPSGNDDSSHCFQWYGSFLPKKTFPWVLWDLFDLKCIKWFLKNKPQKTTIFKVLNDSKEDHINS